MARTSQKRGIVSKDGPAKRVRAANATRRAQPAKTNKQRTAAARRKAQGVSLAPPSPLNTAPTTVLDVFVFGTGDAGELGLGPEIAEATRPRLNPFLSAASAPATGTTSFDIVQLACGAMHSVALTRDNRIVTWGVNDGGALGRNTDWEGGMTELNEGDSDSDSDAQGASLNPHESTPTAIDPSSFPAGTVFTQVAAGDSCSFALTDTGLVYGWGMFRTRDGQEFFLPHPTTGQVGEKQRVPVRIPGLQGITQIVAGANHALALQGRAGGPRQTRAKTGAGTGTGTGARNPVHVWAWGSNDMDQLGRRLVRRRRPLYKDDVVLDAAAEPVLVEMPGRAAEDIALVAAGEYHAFAVGASGRVWAWGLNTFGETGAAPDELRRRGADASPTIPGPTQVAALAGERVVALAGGGHHSTAVTADGRCLVWGRIDAGQLGMALAELEAADAAARDPAHRRLLRDERGRSRACLLPATVNLNLGTATAADTTAVAVACGTDHTIIVTAASPHGVFGAGYNGQAQLGIGGGEDDDDEVPVATCLRSKTLRSRRLTWAGAGAQYSMVAGPRPG
ncbi:regulator of chromosome condensation [Sporothrix brasiliensis 5110]|uniref:Regulator of chromosome condensation n=1 Tax=Sporothrix brasiliensis 5110 TaxID=1398154 RepID=A0A0C2FHQ3_9PEZI|nr:regulator of chromosome condensation [Sporothrix brasiliensis 5110]KIH90603.1 regulator of chromosome condensation [Sporothrix brasiliensis 5110]